MSLTLCNCPSPNALSPWRVRQGERGQEARRKAANVQNKKSTGVIIRNCNHVVNALQLPLTLALSPWRVRHGERGQEARRKAIS